MRKFGFRDRGTSKASSKATRSPDSHPRPEYSRTRNPMIPAATLALSMSLRLIVPASPFDDTIPGNSSSIAVTRESRASGK